ncbi:unnamed protein product [Mycena citricolor]|uniref:Mediator of RNA polymerase II transcription subunit 13 n=1 Tax=Mycena citricolor TaxID=2018698 RepID=A0AAD2HTJ4_9AGAR|nr:unnamed protein product [Mycena citricolor]
MAAKQTSPVPPARPGLSSSDHLLSSTIPLPADAHITCYVYAPVAGPSTPSRAYTDILELARRDILNQNHAPQNHFSNISPSSTSLTDSILTSVYIHGSDSCLYAFTIDCRGATSALARLQLEGLSVTSQCTFSPAEMYLWCPECAGLPGPCSSCLNSPQPPHQHLVRPPIRAAVSHFLEAVRIRLIDDMSVASTCSTKGRSARPIKRLKGGFVLSPPPSSSEWSKGWDTKACSRPLISCHLQIHLSISSPRGPAQIVIHPQMHVTPFVALPMSPSRGPGRPAEGAPITLLPLGIPAFYLAAYSGPTSALRRQFRDSLAGLGVSGWETGDDSVSQTTFIIAWINVENKQGEEKGITVIYPSSLCLLFVPSLTSSSSFPAARRESLAYIPELPPQLQPSPQLTAAIPGSHMLQTSAVASHLRGHLRSCSGTPSPHALRAYRGLTVSRARQVRHVAGEVNVFVDAVAKERERERERMRRERESSRSSVPTVAAAALVVQPAQVQAQVQAPPQPQPQLPVQTQAQTFYPSPPQVDHPVPPVEEGRSSPVAVATPAASVALQATQPDQRAFDPLFDSMDYDNIMGDFGGIMEMGMFGHAASSSNNNNNHNNSNSNAAPQAVPVAMDFDTDFTDDDFSFFDRPQTTLPVVSGSMGLPVSMSSSDAHLRAPGMMGMLGMGLGGTMPMPMSISPPVFGLGTGLGVGLGESPGDWAATANAFTPGGASELNHLMASLPDLMPPSPGETPQTTGSSSAPSTPSVQLVAEELGGVRLFDPIPFAESHRLADGKYAVGKFALPSPPPEEDDDFEIEQHRGWQFKYASATDPRIGVVRKLIGVKRKTSTSTDKRPKFKASPAWAREHEDWEQQPAIPSDTESEPESEDGDGDLDEDSNPMMSRPSTPTPSYLPLGPTLLHTHFQHSQLLPLSNALRPPGSAVAATPIYHNPASASVPTPVSPAALLGAASEKSKSLEAAALSVGTEVVENALWAESWRPGMAGYLSRDAVWPADVRRVAELLSGVREVEGPLDLGALFDVDHVDRVESPLISVGKGESAVIQVLPTALRFWDKLGLSPRGGRKNAVVFVLFEDDGSTRADLASAWLHKLLFLYETCQLGTLTPGSHPLCSRDGFFPIRFDSTFRKSLAAFIAAMPTLSDVVFYVFTPMSTMTLSSPLLRQILSSVKKALQAREGLQTRFQFVPEAALAFTSAANPAAQVADLEAVAYSTYDKILRPVERPIAQRADQDAVPAVRRYFCDPVYTLARRGPATVKFAWHSARAPLDVVDAGTQLHVGYGFSECGKWVLAACVDQRGEAYQLGVWLAVPVNDGESLTREEHAVKKVWGLACQFAKQASLAWRIVVARLGSMQVAELEAWSSLADAHLTLLSVEPDAAWSFLPTASTKPQPPQTPPSVTGKPQQQCQQRLAPDACAHPMPVQPLASAVLVRVPAPSIASTPSMMRVDWLLARGPPPAAADMAEITRSFHDLSVLGSLRWRLPRSGADPILPFQLGAVDVMAKALGCEA